MDPLLNQLLKVTPRFIDTLPAAPKPNDWWFVVWKIEIPSEGKKFEFVKKINDPTGSMEKGWYTTLHPRNVKNKYNLIKEILKGLNQDE